MALRGGRHLRPGRNHLCGAALAAGRRGLLTIGLFGPGDAPPEPALDARFAVHSADPTVVQEVHETLYHVLWELVHVYFEHEGLLA